MVSRRKRRSQALVRSTTQRWRASGSLVRVTRRRPRLPCRCVLPAASGSPGRRRLLIWGVLVFVAGAEPDLQRPTVGVYGKGKRSVPGPRSDEGGDRVAACVGGEDV